MDLNAPAGAGQTTVRPAGEEGMEVWAPSTDLCEKKSATGLPRLGTGGKLSLSRLLQWRPVGQ
jgi:hypothetical protein